MATEKFNEIGKGGIVKEGIFVRFPELIPAEGSNYWRGDGKRKRLLLIGESNYFTRDWAEKSVFMDAERWYKEDTDKLIPEEKKIDVSNYIDYPTFNKVFDIMDKVLDENGIEHERGLGEGAFYNYFLRPALSEGGNRGFKPENIDNEVAGVALAGIIQVISPDIIIFLSKKAYLAFKAYCERNGLSYANIYIDHLSHPSSSWWYRYECARRFEELLNKYWINH